MNHIPVSGPYPDSTAIAWSMFCNPQAARDGFAWPFRLGLRPLGNDQWPIKDSDYQRQIALKHRLFDANPAAVWQCLPGYEEAQAEAWALLFGHEPAPVAPIRQAGARVQEDLVLMSPKDGAHILSVGHVCFPSSWDLQQKIGLPMAQVHNPVPGFETETQNAQMIERMFTHLKPAQPMQRMNWSIMEHDSLHVPQPHDHVINVAKDWRRLTLRIERQTLHKLPKSKSLLFTIRIFVEPLALLRRQADPLHWEGFLTQLGSMNSAELAYKGIES